MNILITAGGTSEKIDDVRHLTNHATGSLGKELATCLQKQPDVSIYYIYGPSAVLPDKLNTYFFPISSVRELENQMKQLLTTISFDYVVHSMAVSDYELESATNEDILAKKMANQLFTKNFEDKQQLETFIQQLLTEAPLKAELTQKKISSDHEKLILVMRKSPKVISSIKKWQPDTKLIGFKLLVDVTDDELLAAAQKSITTNQADWILANDLINIQGDAHEALLISSLGIIERFKTKKEIANGLAHLMLANNGKEA